MAEKLPTPARPQNIPGLPEDVRIQKFDGFEGLNTKAPRPKIGDQQMSYCDTFMPLGKNNLRTMYDIGGFIINVAQTVQFVCGVTVITPGAYSQPPVVTLVGGGGTGATAIAVLSGTSVVSVTITDSGAGYTTPPAVVFDTEFGSGASATAILCNTPVQPVTVPTDIVFSPSSPTIVDNVGVGANVSSFTVTMSDGSTYTGSNALTANDSGNYALASASSNSSILANQNPLTRGNRSVTLQATQNNSSISKILPITVHSHAGIPTLITFNPSAPVILDNIGVGTQVATFTVTMDDGSLYVGNNTLTASDGGNFAVSVASGNGAILANANPLTDGNRSVTLQVSEHGTSISKTLPIVVNLPPVPISISVSPASPSVVQTAASGTQVCTFIVNMSDSSTYIGSNTLTSSDSGNFALSTFSGNGGIITAASLSGLAGTNRSITLKATENGASVSQAITIAVTSAIALTEARTLTNLNLSSSTPNPAFWIFGQPFAQGSIPSGSKATATLGGTPVPLDLTTATFHNDGSIAWAQLIVDLSAATITSGATQTLSYSSTGGTFPTSTNRSVSEAVSQNWTVELLNMSYSGSTGSVTGASSANNTITIGWSWFANGQNVQFTGGSLPGGITAGTTYFFRQFNSSGLYNLYDTQAHAIAGGGTGLITITTSGTGTFTLVTPEADMAPAGTSIATFDNTATWTIYGQGTHLQFIAEAIPTNASVANRMLRVRLEVNLFQKQDGTLAGISTRGPFVRNLLGFKNNPSSFTYDLNFKQNGTLIRSYTRVTEPIFCEYSFTEFGGGFDYVTLTDPQIDCGADYTVTRKTKKIPPYLTGISYTTPSVATVTTISSSVITLDQGRPIFGNGNNADNAGYPVAVDFIATSMASGISPGTIYWARPLSGTTMTIYSNRSNAITGGSTGQIVVHTSGINVQARISVAPMSRACIDPHMSDTGNRDDLGLLSEWGAAYHVSNTFAARRRARVVAYQMMNFSFGLINDATGLIPSMLSTSAPYQTPTAMGQSYGSGGPFLRWVDNLLGGIGNGANTVSGGRSLCADANPDIQHWPSFGIFSVWLMEGGATLRDTIIFNGNRGIGNVEFGAQRSYQVNGTGQVYDCAVLPYGSGGSMRGAAWSFRDLNYAAFAAPPSTTANTIASGAIRSYFHIALQSNCDLAVAFRNAQSASFRSLGLIDFQTYDVRTQEVVCDFFMFNYLGNALAYSFMLNGDDPLYSTNFTTLRDSYMPFLANLTKPCPYFSDNYTQCFTLGVTSGTGAYNYISSVSNRGIAGGGDTPYAYSPDGTVTIPALNGMSLPNYVPQNGDQFRPSNVKSQTVLLNVPSLDAGDFPPQDISPTTYYYIVNFRSGGPGGGSLSITSAYSFKLSTTVGGPALTFPTPNGTITAVNTTSGSLTIPNHNLTNQWNSGTLSPIWFFNTGGALPTGISPGIPGGNGTFYYPWVNDNNTITIYNTAANAIAHGATGKIIPSDAGSGTNVFYPVWSGGYFDPGTCPIGDVQGSASNPDSYMAWMISAIGVGAVAGNATCLSAFSAYAANFSGNYNTTCQWGVQGNI